LARKALYKHATQVDTNTYPDDGTSPVGSNEWNADPDSQGMLGFAPATATITIASGVATVTDTITVVAAESSTSDTLDKLAIANTSQYDLVYLFADTGDTITLANTSSPSADGQIRTVSDSNETLSTTVPTILIRKGNHWYGYGGGVVNAVSDIGDVTISSIASGEILKWNGSAWINQTLAESGISPAAGSSSITTVGTLGTLSVDNLTIDANNIQATNTNGNITLDSNGTGVIEVLGNTNDGAITLNCTSNSHGQTIKSQPHSETATNTMLLPKGANSTLVSLVSADTLTNKTLVAPALGTPASGVATNLTGTAASLTAGNVTTNANLTGDVTSSGNATTIATDAVDIAMLSATGTASSSTYLRGDNTWAAAGGASAVHQYTAQTSTTYVGTASSFSTVGSGTRDIYIKKIDANNEGVFTKIWKNGAAVEVQIA
jgi:hypothetical protein